jgi:hypothetical protein
MQDLRLLRPPRTRPPVYDVETLLRNAVLAHRLSSVRALYSRIQTDGAFVYWVEVDLWIPEQLTALDKIHTEVQARVPAKIVERREVLVNRPPHPAFAAACFFWGPVERATNPNEFRREIAFRDIGGAE